MILMMDLIEELGLKYSSYRYQMGVGHVPKPERYLGRLVYQDEVADEIRKYFNSREKYQRVDPR